MRNVGPHILEDKMDEAVTHYINTHQAGEQVHVDANALALSVPDDGGGRVTVMHSQNFSSPLCRQVSVGEGVEGQWGEELLDAEGRLAALVAHLAQHPRFPHHHHTTHHKVTAGRSEVDASVILDTAPMRLFNAQTMDPQSDSITVHVPSLPPLPPLQDMKRCRDNSWFNEKDKTALKSDAPLPGGTSPGGERLPSKKSLPHKKRISRKLKRNTGNCTPHQDIVVINCAEVEQDIATAEEILPDSFATQHQGHLPGDTHHITHEVRPMFICQLCGEFYGDEQLKFYHHLKQHYEPHSTIIIENPVPDLGIDKMTNTCIVDNVAALPDSIVELSLENTVPKTLYHQPMDKHILYSNDKSLNYTGNKVQYSMDKETHETEKTDLYETLEDKLGLYSCSKCNKSFRKQKQCEAHIKEVHCNPKIEEMSEFSEPEDLMEGIHVSVEEGAEGAEGEGDGEGEGGDYYGGNVAPHLTVDKGQVHQEHVRQWYIRGGPAPPAPPYDVCPPTPREDHPPHNLKEEVHTLVQRILDTPESNFPENILPEGNDLPPEAPPDPKTRPVPSDSSKKKEKQYVCTHCSRVFHHRGSLLYHTLSHSAKQQVCRDCGKSFYTPRALTIHRRVHSGDRPYKCEVCGKDFRQWSDLNYHKMSLHSNQKQFKCEFCDKEFARKYSLSVHRRIHTGERNYKCEYCNKTFRASSYRLAHMRIHTGDRPHKCEQCGRSFRAPFDLRRHQLIHERVRNRTDEQKKGKETKPKAEKNDTKITKPVKKVAVASTAKLPVLKNIEKKTPKNTKKTPKKGAPNITVQNGQLKPNSEYTNNVEVFDTRQEYKYKDGYTDNVVFKEDLAYKIKDYNHYKEEGERDIALKPFRPDADEKIRADTDGKIMYCNTSNAKEYTTLVQNSSISQVSLGELRHLERDVRPELQGENIECYFDSFTSLYHIPA